MKTNRLISLLLCLCMVATLFTGFAETASADDYITYTVKSGDNLYSLVGKMGMNYGTVKYVIMALNGFTNEAQLSQLQPGQTIILPTSNQAAASLAAKATTAATTAVATTAAAAAATATTATTATTTTTSTTAASTYNGYTPAYYLVQHQVQKGETLTSICKALGTNYYDYKSVILNLNKLANDSSLKVGQVLWVPAKVGSAGGTIAVIAYSVAPGDSISSICAQYDTSYANYKDAVKAVNPKVKNLEKLNVGQTVYIPVYTSYNNAVAGNPSSAAGNDGAPSVTQATGYSISFTATDNKKFGNPFAIVGNQSNVQRAQAGSTVIIRPNAYSGYAVTGVKVVRTDSNAHVAVNDYAFTMPNSNVQITIDYAAGKQIRKLNSPHGSFDTYVYGSAADSAFYGDEVTIVPYPDEGYEVDKVEVYDGTSTSTTPLFTVTKDTKTNSYHFVMPNQHAKVKVTFKVSTTVKLLYNTHSALYSGDSSIFTGNGIVKFFVGGQEVTEANPGETVTAVIIPADGWIITGEPLFLGDIDPLFPATLQAKKVAEYTYTFKVADPAVFHVVGLYIQFTERTPYYLLSVNLTGSGNPGLISFTVTDGLTGKVRQNAEYAFPGDTVKIVPYTTSGMRWNTTGSTPIGEAFDYEYNPTETKLHTTIAITGAVLKDTYWIDPGYEFEMPAAGVNVEARFDAPGYGGAGTYNVETEADAFVANRKYIIVGGQSEYGGVEIYDGDPSLPGSKPVGTASPGTTLWIKITPNTNYRVKRDYDSNTGKPFQYYIYYANAETYGGYSQVPLGDVKESATTSIVTAKFKMPKNDSQVVVYYEQFYQNAAASSGYDTVKIKAFNIDDGTPYSVTDLYAGTKILSDSVGNYNVQMWINGVHVKDESEAVAGNVVILRFELKDDRKLEKVLVRRTNSSGSYDTKELLPNGDGYYWYLIDEQDVNAGVDYLIEKYPLEFRVYTSTVEKPKYTISHGGVFDSSRLVNLQGIGKYVIDNIDSGDPPVTDMGILKAAKGDRIDIYIYPAEGYVLDQVNVVGIDNFTMGDLKWTKDDSGKDCWYYEFIMPAQDLTTEVLYKEYANDLAEMLDP